LTKPLLISSLAVYFYQSAAGTFGAWRSLIFAGLIFSVIGDVLLLFAKNPENGETFFLLGLGSFLVTQVCYAAGFAKIHPAWGGILSKKRWLVLPLLTYFVLIFSQLWSGIPSAMKVPVAVYAVAIFSMTASAQNLGGRIRKADFQLIFCGALLFMVSDSLIALTKFGSGFFQIPNPPFFIMLTYLAGQGLIVKGAVRYLHP
jgi:uncharacterized membrane protein YhhN